MMGSDMDGGNFDHFISAGNSKKKIMHATNLIDHFIEHNNPQRENNQ